jgi:hypothetical protein
MGRRAGIELVFGYRESARFLLSGQIMNWWIRQHWRFNRSRRRSAYHLMRKLARSLQRSRVLEWTRLESRIIVTAQTGLQGKGTV